MKLNYVIELLSSKRIPFEIVEYACVGDFGKHIMLFPSVEKAPLSKAVAVVIKSNNKHKNLELLFIESEEGWLFENLWFGEYSFDAFEYEPDILEEKVLSDIESVVSGDYIAFCVNDLKRKRWLGNGLTKKNGEYAEKVRQNMLKPKSWIEKISRTQKQYELYDWNNYQIIIK